MTKTDNSVNKRRLRSSYFTAIISISLVLFLLGLVGLLILNAKRISDYVKENIGFSVILNENIKEVDIKWFQKNLDAKRYTKSTKYITKEEAAEELKEALGEDFVDFLGYNPLLASIDVKLYAQYANPDSIATIEKELQNLEQVKEVFYQKNLVHLVNENIRKISFIILLFSILLFVIAFTLINNTIRLSIYAKRFLINTMQLVGATRSFIRKPFLFKGILHGILGGTIAILLLIGIIYIIQKEMKEFLEFIDITMLTLLFLTVIILGIVINGISTYFAVNKYLRIKTEDLYY